MSQLTLEEYWKFHTEVYLELAKKENKELSLKEISNRSSKETRYVLSIKNKEYEGHYYSHLEEKVISKIKNVEEIEPYIIMLIEKKTHLDAEDGYEEIAYKIGNTKEVMFFVNYVLKMTNIRITKQRILSNSFYISFEKLLQNLSHREDNLEIIKDYFNDRGLLDKLVDKIKVKKILNSEFKNRVNQFDDLFDGIFNFTKDKVISGLLKKEKDFNTICAWIELIENKEKALPFVNNFLKSIDVNTQSNLVQVKIRDSLIKKFPTDLSTFSWLNLLKENDIPMFEFYLDKKYLSLIINMNEIQKNYPFDNIGIKSYIIMMEILKDHLKECDSLEIEDIYRNEASENNHIEKWVVVVSQISKLTESQLRKIVIGAIDIKMRSILEENKNITHWHENTSNKQEIKQWLNTYIFSLSLSEDLEEKEETTRSKL